MEKKIKLFCWGPPGVGKSVFACKFPKPFFICTDGNYDWLIEFGAKEDAQFRVNSFKEYVKFMKTNDFTSYDTIVVDLVEDLFKMCEQEWLKRNEIEHPSDMGWGKGYDGPRNEFFMEISKLLNLDKNVLLLCHGEVLEIKRKNGTSYHVYRPSSRLPEKLLDMIEGRVRFMCRALVVTEELEDKKVKKRYLQISSNEDTDYINARGIDEDNSPEFIPLEYTALMNLIDNKSSKLNLSPEELEKIKEEDNEELKSSKASRKKEESVKKDTKVSKKDLLKQVSQEVEEIKKEEKTIETPIEENESKEDRLAKLKAKLLKKTTEDEEKSEEKSEEKVIPNPEVLVQEDEIIPEPIKVEVKEEIKEEPKIQTKEERLAALKAKLRGGK